MPPAEHRPLFGRERERAAIEAVIEDARRSRSRTLVIHGDPGIGKSALLDDAAARVGDVRVLRAAGVEIEGELAFAGLHELIWPLRALIHLLPAPQASALGVALGSDPAHPTDRFLIGAGVLSLLALAAAEQPLLCLVDDAHWLDRASVEALAFAARRLDSEPVGLLFAVRQESVLLCAGLPQLEVGPLDQEAAEALVRAAAGPPLPPQMRRRLIDQAAGNPLALLELRRALDARTGASRAGALGSTELTPAIENAFLAQVRPLPEASQLLLIAAADDTGDRGALLRAGGQLGISARAIEPLESAGLLDISSEQVLFRHPLVRSAVYHAAPYTQRVAAHAALAAVLEGDRAAWHHAATLTGPDDTVADALERSAERARARGGYAAAATALQRASAISSDERQRARRLAAAAELAWLAGQTTSSTDLLIQADRAHADPRTAADLEYLHGLREFVTGTPADATRRITQAARQIETIDPQRAHTMLLQAWAAAALAADTVAEAHVGNSAEALSACTQQDRLAAGFLGSMARWVEDDLGGASRGSGPRSTPPIAPASNDASSGPASRRSCSATTPTRVTTSSSTSNRPARSERSPSSPRL
jgi:hypothetical protein